MTEDRAGEVGIVIENCIGKRRLVTEGRADKEGPSWREGSGV
jgi:hypothetical protein